MIAFILTGGLGTRLRPLTLSTPKPMIKVAGRPFMESQIRLLSRCGIREFVISTGYLADQIEDYFGDGRRLGVKLLFSRETTPLGTGGALLLAKSLIRDDFLCLNGDDLPLVDYSAFLALAKGKIYHNIMVVHASQEGNLSLDRSLGRVTGYAKQKQPGLKAVHSGLTFFEKEVLGGLPTDIFDYEDYLYNQLIQAGKLYYFESTGRTLSIGSFERLRRARQLLPLVLKEYSIG